MKPNKEQLALNLSRALVQLNEAFVDVTRTWNELNDAVEDDDVQFPRAYPFTSDIGETTEDVQEFVKNFREKLKQIYKGL